MLIQLYDGCWVAADQVAEVKVKEFDYGVTVHMKGGAIHDLGNDYGESSTSTAARLVHEINKALGGGREE